MCDLLWSDPQPQRGRSPSKRGVGIQFGPDITEAFLKLNNLDYVIRSHEVRCQKILALGISVPIESIQRISDLRILPIFFQLGCFCHWFNAL